MDDIVWRAYETADFDEALRRWSGDPGRLAAASGPDGEIASLSGVPVVLKGDPTIDTSAAAVAEVIHAYPPGIMRAVRFREISWADKSGWVDPYDVALDQQDEARAKAWNAVKVSEMVTCRECRSIVAVDHIDTYGREEFTDGDCPVCDEEDGLLPEGAVPDFDSLYAEAKAAAGPEPDPKVVEKIGWVIGGRLQSNPERTRHAEDPDTVRA